eukprot:TRINITY_DN7549_c0_g1_i4.p1 TRINITY_DN7549_c0_g1~~TRINITY_DN7549_c0_g1_i4.p1  ORF type:complete len:130 (+),score=80.60 TRINITY_DN7549_c0_g1_i4:92-481(+)
MYFIIFFFFFFFKQKTAYEMLRSLVGSEMCIRDRANKIKKELPKYIEQCKKIEDDIKRKEEEEGNEKIRKQEKEYTTRMESLANFHKQRNHHAIRAHQINSSPSAQRHREIELSLGTILDEKVETTLKE